VNRSISAEVRAARLWELRQLTSQRQQLLVVCLGNICRSPYAARRLAAALPAGWEVRQGGTLDLPARSSTPEAIAAAAERGIDLSTHASHPVTRADLDAAGAVLVFDWQIRDELVERYPEFAERVFLLGEVTPGSVEIADPMGYPVATYRETYRDIDRRIEHLVTALIGKG
jgi:protein-tyrosine-phosphatase